MGPEAPRENERPSSGSARAAIVLFAALASCGKEVHASDFNQSCALDDDCVPVLIGEVCDCVCGVAAINKADLPKYQEVVSDEACGAFCSPCDHPAEAYCDAGMCAAR